MLVKNCPREDNVVWKDFQVKYSDANPLVLWNKYNIFNMSPKDTILSEILNNRDSLEKELEYLESKLYENNLAQGIPYNQAVLKVKELNSQNSFKNIKYKLTRAFDGAVIASIEIEYDNDLMSFISDVIHNKKENELAAQKVSAEIDEDIKRGVYYQLNPLQKEELNGTIKNRIIEFLSRYDTELRYVKELKNAPANAVGRTTVSGLKKLIELVEERATDNTFVEEAAHILVEVMYTTPLMDNLIATVDIDYKDVFKEVEKEYRDVEGYDWYDIRKEAVAKLITDRIFAKFNDESTVEPELKSWWDKAIKWLRSFFYKAKSSEVAEIEDEIDNLALTLLGKNKTEVENKELFFSPKYQLSNISKQLDEFTENIISPNDDSDEGNTRYKNKDTGKEIANRVTDESKKIFEKAVGKDKAEEINNLPKNLIARKYGTEFHAALRRLVIEEAESRHNITIKGDVQSIKSIEYSSLLTPKYLEVLRNGARIIVDNVSSVQSSIDPSGKLELRTEQVIYDKDTDTAGSMDVLVLYSDNSASFLDYKFTSFPYKYANGERVVTKDTVNQLKFDGWNLQLTTYKKMLKKIGITSFRQTRVIPINTQYKETKVGDVFVTKEELYDIEMLDSDKAYLDEIALAGELTNDKNLNDYILKLTSERRNIEEELKKSYTNERLQNRLELLTKTINGLIIKQDVKNAAIEALVFTKSVQDRINIDNTQDKNYITDSEINEILQSIKLYKELVPASFNVREKLKQEDEKTYAGIQRLIERVNTGLTDLEAVMNDALLNRLTEFTQIEGLNSAQKEVGFWDSLFTYTSQFEQPVFKAFTKIIRKVKGQTREQMLDLEKELKDKKEAVLNWGKKRGITGLNVYNKLLNKDKQSLIQIYSKDFWQQLKKAREDNNIKWLRENITQSDAQKEFYEKRKDNYMSWVDRTYPDVIEEGGVKIKDNETYRKKLKENWLNKNDFSKDTAIVSSSIYFSVKEELKNKWYSEEYKEILKPENKELLDFYNFYTKKMETFTSYLDINKSHNWLPSISKGLVERITTNGIGTFSALKDSYINSIKLREDERFMYSDAFTGETLYRLPKPFTEEISDKSFDLASSLYLFGEVAINYKFSSEVESSVIGLRNMLSRERRKQIVTSQSGKTLRDAVTQAEKIAIGSNDILTTFDRHVNSLFYGQPLQGKELFGSIEDKEGNEYSGNKIILSAMQYFSIKALAWNPVVIAANVVSGKANAYMTGAKGLYYTNASLTKAHKLFTHADNKYAAVIDFFRINADNHTYQKANKLSVSKAVKAFTLDKLMYGLRKGDDIINNNVLAAMLIDHTIKDGKIVRKKGEEKSAFDMIEIKDDNIVIPNVNNEEFERFRNKVIKVVGGIKGSTSKEDINAIQTMLIGRAVMQFRNWMVRMAQVRFGNFKFDQDLETYEIGRYKVFAGELFSSTLGDSFKNMISIGTEIAVGWAGKGRTVARTEHYYEKWKKENPDSNITLEEYQAVRQAEFKAAVAELRIFIMLIGASLAAGYDGDDDGKADLKASKSGAYLLKVLDRFANEAGFFLLPTSAEVILKKPVAIMGLGIDAVNLIQNSFDELTDLTNTPKEEKREKDKTGVGHYTIKMFPMLTLGADVIELAFEEEEKRQK